MSDQGDDVVRAAMKPFRELTDTELIAAAIDLIKSRNASLPRLIERELRAAIVLIKHHWYPDFRPEFRVKNAAHAAIDYIEERHGGDHLSKLVIAGLRTAVIDVQWGKPSPYSGVKPGVTFGNRELPMQAAADQLPEVYE